MCILSVKTGRLVGNHSLLCGMRIAGFLALVVSTLAQAQDLRLLYGLRGDWKIELGDEKRWKDHSFDDSKWETVYAPAFWEDEGFPGYDGYAWYRKHFQAKEEWRGKSLVLQLGRIDDVDEVYVNGKLVGGTGSFPPDYESAYNMDRNYELPATFLNIPGDNVIAVRVYDDELGGGIYDGKSGVYEDRNALVPEATFEADWKFSTGDHLSWKEVNFDDSRWSTISVPGFWEVQGFPDYDGYAWYRLRFRISSELADKRLILLLGNIDDFDETYLNGKLIGKTGTMGKEIVPNQSTEYRDMRAYTIPSGQLRVGGDNVIAVRVYDGFKDGGIYRGPIGIVSRERFMKWRDAERESWFDWFVK